MSRLLSAIGASDTATVDALSTQDAADRLATMRQRDPALFNAAASGMDVVETRVVSRDSIYISFRARTGAREVLDFGLARSEAGWRVYYFTVPSRM